MRVGEAIIRLLEGYGVDTIFGIPGTHSIELYRGLSASSIRHILPRNEQGGGFMADGYARVTGKPGVCFVITGPGVTNLSTPMGQAYSDSIPLLVISPVNDVHPDGINRGRLHELNDQVALTKPITAFSEYVNSADEIPVLIARAFQMFATDRPRPVHLHIPLSVLRSDQQVAWTPSAIAPPVEPDASALDRVLAQINAAERPVIVAGGGCRHFGELVTSLAEKAAIPVITTVAGRGVIAGKNPLSVGTQLATSSARALLAESDLGLFLGTELAEPDHWTERLELPDSQIWVNLDQELLDLRGSGECLNTDARLFLPALASLVEQCSIDETRAAVGRINTVKKLLEQPTEKQHKHLRVWTEIGKSVPPGVCIFTDMTQLAYSALDYLSLETSNSWMHPNGFGTLGFAVPAAIGAKCAQAELPVLAVAGDSGIQYTQAEMSVATELQLNLVVLVWNNNKLQQINDDMVDAGIEPVAVQQLNPDFIALAEAYGWKSKKISGLFELSAAVTDAFSHAGPVLLELSEASV